MYLRRTQNAGKCLGHTLRWMARESPSLFLIIIFISQNLDCLNLSQILSILNAHIHLVVNHICATLRCVCPGLGRVMAKLSHTSITAIAMTFLVMNLSIHLSRCKSAFLCLFFKITLFLSPIIIEAYSSTSFRQPKLIFAPCLNN